MKPDVKFGDILTFTDEWYKASGGKRCEKLVRFVATGKIDEQATGEYIIYVVKENKGYILAYHHSFLEKLEAKNGK